MNLGMHKDKKQKLIVFACLFILLLVIFSLFPITGDDWARYAYKDKPVTFARILSSVKRDWLHLNGRIAGNTLSKLLMSPDILRVAAKTLIVFAIYLSMAYLSRLKSLSGYLVLFLLLILLHVEMFREAYQWSAGFYNYVPAVLSILLYFIMLKRFSEGKMKFKKISLLFAFIVASSASLFAEHITVYNLLMSLAIVLYFRIGQKSWNAISITYMLGALSGAFMMFSSPVYSQVLQGEDTYRDVATEATGTLERIIENFKIISYNVLAKQIILLVLLAVIIIYLNIKNDSEKKYLRYLNIFISLAVPLYFFVTNWLLPESLKLSANTGIILDATAYLFLIYALIFTTTKHVKEVIVRRRIYFFLISIAILLLPLFVVSPIGPRLFYIVYVMEVLVIMEFCSYLKVFESLNKKSYVFVLLSLVFLASAFYIYVYGNIRKIEKQRNEFILESIEKNETGIPIPELPYSRYFHPANKDSDKIRYKFYKEKPGDVSFYYLPLEEWKQQRDP